MLGFYATCYLRVAPTLEVEIPGVDGKQMIQAAWREAVPGGSVSARAAEIGPEAEKLVDQAFDQGLGSATDTALALYYLVRGIENPPELLEAAERAAWGASGNQGNPDKRRDFILEELQWQRAAAAAVSGVGMEDINGSLAELCEKVPGWFLDFAARFPSVSWTAHDRLRNELRRPFP